MYYVPTQSHGGSNQMLTGSSGILGIAKMGANGKVERFALTI